jgi:hypothetical protein
MSEGMQDSGVEYSNMGEELFTIKREVFGICSEL